MLASRPKPMTVEEYLAWEELQEEKHELLGGFPTPKWLRADRDPVTGMAGTSRRHNEISANCMFQLRRRLGGGPCRAIQSDTKVVTDAGDVRYPDVLVDCGPIGTSMIAGEPRMVLEVLSPSNTKGQQVDLLNGYQATASVQQIVFVEQQRARVSVWVRHETGWSDREDIVGLQAELSVPSLGLSLPLAEVYESVEFDPA